ncbi:hypothetical protein GS429_16335 [Natronorubrum sp. JWXQ-INN-674]|uniref:YbjN domain-containing protein n=1 Tax=Natronorubrum halalkaliphilum TaxID=2691917 RepID=A0A6B0VR98_9EURY|nr:DUF5813 family protein [Natronorubrum halalkaliphilum]MXV63597.1 hypothetical protein [Natronorubrum halalkaliphilum]
MTEVPDSVARQLESHDAFESVADSYRLTTTVFDTTVGATEADGKRDGRFHVTVSLPTLDAAVADETVATVVEDGWFETLERRLEDVFTVAHTSTHEEPVVDRDATEVTVTLEYVAWDAGEGVEDAKALIEYVEGTYAQGIIPGYEYQGAAATLLENAQSRGQQAADGDTESGGMPM